MPYTIQTLTDEITDDPMALGYAAHIAAGRLGAVAGILDQTRGGVGTVYRKDMKPGEMMSYVVASEIGSLTTNNLLALLALILASQDGLNATSTNTRAQFAAIFAGANFSLTRAALDAGARVVAPTRAEELWGAGTTVPVTDVAKALGRN